MRLPEEDQSYYAENEKSEHSQMNEEQREADEDGRIHQQHYEENRRIYEEHREARGNEENGDPNDEYYSADENELDDTELFLLNAVIEENEQNEVEQLRLWARDSKVPLCHLDSLLVILRKRLLTELPKTDKTFLGTT